MNHKRPVSKIVIILLTSSIFLGCYYDNAEDSYPTLNNSVCDTAQISFSAKVLPLMNTHCNTAGCHNSQDRAFGIVLDNYTDLLVSANEGSLVGSMEHRAGFIPMPEGASKLDNCSIQLIIDWIAQGSLNN